MNYVGRPGISPALALLVATAEIQARHRILEIGCGTGTDAITLARWGFRRIDAIDPDAKAIATARGRASRLRVRDPPRFHHAGAERLAELFSAESFDVGLHTLVANNLTKEHDLHFREIAKVLKPGALLLVHERVSRKHENQAPGRFGPLRELKRYFRLSPGVTTHLAELPAGRPGPHYARVVLWVGRRRRLPRP